MHPATIGTQKVKPCDPLGSLLNAIVRIRLLLFRGVSVNRLRP
jgi:hypothetical protein